MPSYRGEGVLLVDPSSNRKIGDAAATWVSQESCPPDCAFKDAGCYAESGPAGIVTRRLNEQEGKGVWELAKEEARLLEAVKPTRDVRLHVVGDTRTRRGAKRLAVAERKIRKEGRRVWGYTHAWGKVPRADWGNISMLASCETVDQVWEAGWRGYASAIVVPKFESSRMYSYRGLKLLPCPWQTRGVTCTKCRLCLDDSKLHARGITIGFEPHGVKSKRVALKVLEIQNAARVGCDAVSSDMPRSGDHQPDLEKGG